MLRQTHVPKEIIVADDGSTDGGGDGARRLGEGRVQVLHQDHAGVSAARNAGIRHASPPWVALLDAEDTRHPDFLRSCMQAAARHPEAVSVFANFQRDGSSKVRLRGKPGDDFVLLTDYFRFALGNRGFGMTAVC